MIQHFSLLHTIHGDDERELINDTELSRALLDYTPQNKVSVRNMKRRILNIKNHIIKNFNSPIHSKDLFPHPDDVMSYGIDLSDRKTESWGEENGCNREPPPDLEQFYWEEAKKKE